MQILSHRSLPDGPAENDAKRSAGPVAERDG